MWEGNTYEDDLAVLKQAGVFPPCATGLTDAAGYDLRRLVEYAFARVGRENTGRRIASAVVYRIDKEHTEQRLVKYLKPWAEQAANIRFLQWLVCKELGREMEPSATKAHVEADVIDYLMMELTGQEFLAPEPVYA